MNAAQIKLILVFSIFAVIGFGPISPGCLIGMYVVWKRPNWFKQIIRDLYQHKAPSINQSSKRTRVKVFITLIMLFTIDILPYPITPTVAFFIILMRPDWFLNTVEAVYQDT